LALGLVLLAGLLLALGGVRLRAAARLLKGLGEDLLLGRLGRGDLQLALGTRQALELLPVAGDLQDALHRLGRLRADLQPVLGPLGVDLDEARLLLRVVLADRLDGLAIPTGARVGDDDPVVGVTDLAKALQSDLDGHVCGTPRSFALRLVDRARSEWGRMLQSQDSQAPGAVRGSGRSSKQTFCQMTRSGMTAVPTTPALRRAR